MTVAILMFFFLQFFHGARTQSPFFCEGGGGEIIKYIEGNCNNKIRAGSKGAVACVLILYIKSIIVAFYATSTTHARARASFISTSAAAFVVLSTTCS